MATKPDFGPCAACGVNNSHAASRCRSCNAPLQWSKGAAGTQAPPIPPAMSQHHPAPVQQPYSGQYQQPQSNMGQGQFVAPPNPNVSALQHQTGYGAAYGSPQQTGYGAPQVYSGAPPIAGSSQPSRHVSNWNWSAIAVQLVGGAIFVGGAFLWCGNVFGFYPTFPGLGYLTMLGGGAVWRGGASMS